MDADIILSQLMNGYDFVHECEELYQSAKNGMPDFESMKKEAENSNKYFPAFFADFTDPSDKINGVCKSNASSLNIDRHKQIMLPGGNNTDMIIYNDLTCEADYLPIMLWMLTLS